MKFLTAFFVLSSVCTAFGQGKFAISVQAAPVFNHTTYEILLPAELDPNNPQTMPYVPATSQSTGYSYSLGANVRYSFTSKWSASTGIWASHNFAGTSDFRINGTPYPVPSLSGIPYTVAYRTPVLLNFQSSTRRLSPYFSAGITLNYRPKSYFSNDNGEVVIVKSGKPITVTPLVGAGFIYQTGNRTSLIVQPAFQYAIHAHPTYQYYHSYSVSLLTQFMYHF